MKVTATSRSSKSCIKLYIYYFIDEDTNVVSNIDKTPFRAPIASVDEEGEDEVSKLVTYRTTTTTTSRIVSWPGTYFFKPIEPGEKQSHYPEEVGLLFGFDDVKPHQGRASCDHLKPEDPAVRAAQGKRVFPSNSINHFSNLK